MLVVVTLVASMAVQYVTTSVATAQTGDLCDPRDGAQFSDVGERDYGAAYILCMRALGLSVGKGNGEYGPDDPLTRAQAASFFVRLWRDVLGRECPEVDHPFQDVSSSSTHAAAIGCLFGLGITEGTGPTTYEPSAHLKASQISRFLLRLWERLGNACNPAGGELARAGACLTDLRVTPGAAAEAISGEKVIRSQMAVYMIGLWHQAAGRGAPPPPPLRPGSATRGEACGLATVGDWYYGTWEDSEFGVVHVWDLSSASVSWERPSHGQGEDCWWDAKLSLVCREGGAWYYSLAWDDLRQIEPDAGGYVSISTDPGDPGLAWDGQFPVQTYTSAEGDPAAYIDIWPGSVAGYDWAGYIDHALSRGELRLEFPDTGAWIVFGAADGWQDAFRGCAGVSPGDTTGYSIADACRPDGPNAGLSDDTTAGFPLPSWAAASTGVFEVAVLFADFPDAPASDNDKADVDRNLAETERYLETASGGRLDVQLHPHPGWLTAERGWREYLEDVNGDLVLSDGLVEETVLRAERSSGFNGASYDSLLVVLPRSGFGGGLASTGDSIGNAAGVTRWALINNQMRNQIPTESRDRDWWYVAAHELVHNLGLSDLYPYDPETRATPSQPRDRQWARFGVGLMGLEVNFPVPPRAFAFKVDFPSGYVDQTGYDRDLEAREMLAWSRWQLGWLDEARVACLANPTDVTVELGPVAAPGDGLVMVAIPHHADGRLVIVVESRRPVGYDRPETVSGNVSGVSYRYTDHPLPGEGIMIYLVRADRDSGELPLLLSTDPGDGEVDEPPIMTPGSTWWLGEPGTPGGQYRIEIVSSAPDTDTIRVTFRP